MPLIKSKFKILRRFNKNFPSIISNLKIKKIYQRDIKKTKKKESSINKKEEDIKISTPKVFREKFFAKQQIKINYLLSEKKLKKNIKEAFFLNNLNSLGVVLNLYNILEFSLDNILFKLGLANTLLSAKQLINHRNIFVNDHICNKPKYNCSLNDIIQTKKMFEIKLHKDFSDKIIIFNNSIKIIEKHNIIFDEDIKLLLLKTIEYF